MIKAASLALGLLVSFSALAQTAGDTQNAGPQATGNFVSGNKTGNGTDFIAGRPQGNGTDFVAGDPAESGPDFVKGKKDDTGNMTRGKAR